MTSKWKLLNIVECMKLALEEAKTSLREGNNGFGAVIVKNGQAVACTHDTECTECDPTAHAEIKAIKEASKKLGRNFSGCAIVSTHEPCPMCASAIVWAGITEVAFGYSIKEAIAQGRKRIRLPCKEVFERAETNTKIHENLLN